MKSLLIDLLMILIAVLTTGTIGAVLAITIMIDRFNF